MCSFSTSQVRLAPAPGATLGLSHPVALGLGPAGMSLLNHVEASSGPQHRPAALSPTALPNQKPPRRPQPLQRSARRCLAARATALCTLAFSARLDVCTLSLTPLTCGRDLRCAFSHLLAPD